MMAPPWRTLAGAAALFVVASAHAGAQTTSAPADGCAAASATEPVAITTGLALATFDTAWSVIDTKHFDTTFNGVDWQAVRTELRPRAAEATSANALRTVLRDMIDRLGQSHFSVIPREASRADPDDGASGEVGIDTRFIADRALVYSVAPGSAAELAGVRPGWTIAAIDGCDVEALTRGVRSAMSGRMARLSASRMVEARLRGTVGTTTSITVLDGSDARRTIALRREEPRGEVVRLMGLPPMRANFEARRIPAAGGRTIGYLVFDGWFPTLTRRIDSALVAFRDADGVIIDLRGNGGGVGGMVMGVAGHFLLTQDTLGTMMMRGATMQFVANPRTVTAAGERVETMRGPLAILVDGGSASTSEIFAGAMQAIGRAQVFGDTTLGAALPAVTRRLPNDDVLYHAIADFTIPGGTRLEGRGVIPDVVTPLTRADLLAGRDVTLDAAVRWITSRPREP